MDRPSLETRLPRNKQTNKLSSSLFLVSKYYIRNFKFLSFICFASLLTVAEKDISSHVIATKLNVKKNFFFSPVPSVKITGDPEMYVESGSKVVLRCVISKWLVMP